MSKESAPFKNIKTASVKKYVGFEPAKEASPGLMFEMDEDLKKSHEVQLKQQPSSLSMNTASPEVVMSSSNAIAVPATSTSRGLSFQNSVGSPTNTMGTGKSFQERLFQTRPADDFGNPNAVSKTPPRSPRTSLNGPEKDKNYTSPQNNQSQGQSQQLSAQAAAKKQRELEFVKPPPNSKKPMTKAERRELQERQRAEKAARQAAASNPNQTPSNATPKPKLPSQPSDSSIATSSPRVSLTSGKKQYKKAPVIDPSAGKVVSLFSHLPQFDPNYIVNREKNVKGAVHPVIMSLGTQFAENVIVGGNARCMALMLALHKVIADYSPPAGTTLQRHLTQHISKQVDFLSNARSLAASMKTAIRFLKNEITGLDFKTPDEDAKKRLCDAILEFIDLRIVLAHNEIIHNLLSGNKIKNGDVILTFARSSIVQKLLIEAHTRGIKFRVIIVDSRPKLEGKDTLAELSKAGLECTYVMTNAVHYVIQEATKVIVGASSVLSNGDVMSRLGTSLICMAAHDANIPVMVLCEVYKFSDTVRLDSFVWNEIGNPEELVNVSNQSPATQLPPCFTSIFPLADVKGDLSGWKVVDNLKLLNLTYDITPARFITMVCCEMGQIPSTLALSVLTKKS